MTLFTVFNVYAAVILLLFTAAPIWGWSSAGASGGTAGAVQMFRI